jgi:tetratricopeptide (TPR) repeat protein
MAAERVNDDGGVRSDREHPTDRPSRDAPSIAVHVLLLSFWLFCATASFLPHVRLWGMNHLAFYPWPVRLAALAVMGASLLPVARREILRWSAMLSTSLAARRYFAAAALAIVALVLFVVFPSSTQLLGDGLYVQNNVERASKVDSGTLAQVLKNPDPNYPGTEMLYLALPRVAARVLGVAPLDVLKVMIALFGASLVFIVSVAFRSPRLAAGEDTTPLVVLAFLSGAVQIFFGYVETYAPVMFFAALFVLSACLTIARRGFLWAPVVCALSAVAMHLLGILLLPALGVLVLWTAVGRNASRRFMLGTLVIAAATIAAVPLAVLTGPIGRFLLPLTPGESTYAVLSADHLVDVLNEILLVLPGFFALGGLVIALGWKQLSVGWRTDGSVPESPDGRSGEFLPTLLFGLSLALPTLLFALLFKPELGMARDWDLFAIVIFGLWTPLFAILRRAGADAVGRRLLEAALPPILVTTAVLTASWIGVNADAGRSVERFESILTYDRTHAGYAYETLASHHHDRGDIVAEIHALERAVESSRNPRYLFTLGLRYYFMDEKERAVRTLETCLQIKPDHAQARQSLIQMLFFMERNEEMLAVGEEGARLFPQEPSYPFFEGMALVRLGRVSAAREAFDRCLRLNPSPEIRNEIEQILGSLPPDPRGETNEQERRGEAR